MDTESIQALAIDGGGTRCRLAIVSDHGYESVESGSANASTDFDGAVQSINIALDAIAQRCGVAASRLADKPAYLGLAGAISAEIVERLAIALPFTCVKVEDDRRAAVRGALGSSDGFIAHCGTGSFFASQLSQRQTFTGGWGPMLDDVASSYWIGKSALTATLDVEDGLTAASPLTTDLLSQFKTPVSIVAFAKDATVAEIAALAKTVTHYARLQDSVATALLRQGARIINDRLDAMGWQNDYRVCLTGGLADCYQPHLRADISNCLIKPSGQPLDGAVALARDFYQVTLQ